MRASRGVLLACAALVLVQPGRTVIADPPTLAQAAAVELKPLGTSYNRAQSAAWIRPDRFAVGRWDGTLTVFRPKSLEGEWGPVLVQSLTTPARQGIQLVASVSQRLFITSNDTRSLALWRSLGDAGYCGSVVGYDPRLGVAVSAAAVATQSGPMVAVGHSAGFVSIWAVSGDMLRLVKAVSIRSPEPVAWSGQSWHIRGIEPYAQGKVVTVSEDGDVCLLAIPEGKVLYRQRYHQRARRGLNDLAVWNDTVAVVNCAVGADDKNLWVYRLDGDRLALVAAEKLAQDCKRTQVFAFSVELVPYQDQLRFLATTEEGLLWLGRVGADMIYVDSELQVAAEGAPVLALHRDPLTILSVAHKIQTFTLGPRPAVSPETRKVAP